jgi:hypothetical protein
MSKWERYRVEQYQPLQEKQSSKWEQYKIQTTQLQNPSVGNRVASGGKAIVAGAAGAVPDTAAMAYNLPAMGVNYALSQGLPLWKAKSLSEVEPSESHPQLPLIPSATEAIDRGIDHVTGGYSETPEDQRHINEALKFGASFATGGGIANVANKTGRSILAKTGNFIGNTNPWQIGGATTAGGTMSYLNAQGASNTESIGGGLAANLAVNAAPELAKGGGNILAKGALGLVGLGKNKLNLEAAKSARDLDIALPKAAASEGKIIALADQFLGKAPISGNIMQKRYTSMGNKVLKELDNAYESVISSKDLVEVEDRITKLYNHAEQILPEKAQIVPQKTTEIIREIKQKIKTFSPSDDEKKLLTELGKIEQNISPSGIKNIPAEVSYLVGTKRSLNGTIGWDVKEKGVKTLLKKVQHSLSEDIAQYGKKNPEWYNYFSDADKLYGKVAQRKQLKDMFSNVESDATGELSYNSLSKVLNNNETRDELKKLVQPEVFERMNKLGTVARAMALKNKNLPNPSGTAATLATTNVLGALAGYGSYATGAGWPIAVKYIIGAPVLAHLLTDKKTLDLAIKFAETGGEKAAIGFNQRMRAITGYTPVTLMREVSKLEQEKQVDNPNVIEISNPLKKHTEENKKRPKGKAMKELLNNPMAQPLRWLGQSPFDKEEK